MVFVNGFIVVVLDLLEGYQCKPVWFVVGSFLLIVLVMIAKVMNSLLLPRLFFFFCLYSSFPSNFTFLFPFFVLFAAFIPADFTDTTYVSLYLIHVYCICVSPQPGFFFQVNPQPVTPVTSLPVSCCMDERHIPVLHYPSSVPPTPERRRRVQHQPAAHRSCHLL